MMSSFERRILDWCRQHALLLFVIAITVISAAVRISNVDARSVDYNVWLKPWYDEIVSKGGLPAVTEQIGDYNVPYQLLIALLSYLPIHPLTLYKGLSCMFDYLLAACAAWIVYDLSAEKIKAVFAYTLVLMLPSVLIDSSYWAQCDSIYCFFLLGMLLCILRQKHFLAFVMFSIAFQFKLQSIFVLPFLLYYYVCTQRFSIANFALVPLMSVIICLLCGRKPFETFSIYLFQTGHWPELVYNFPSIWNLITDDYAYFRTVALLLTISILGAGLLWMIHSKLKFDRQNIFNVLIWSVWTCLLFLPGLHDRYAYFLIILLAVTAVLNVKMAAYLLVCEIVILISYSRFMFPYSQAAATPNYLCSMLFAAMYAAFTYLHLIRGTGWLAAQKAD